MASPWTCPYCNRPCTIGTDDVRVISEAKYISKEYGNYQSDTTIIVCPNDKCRKQTISLDISQLNQQTGNISKRLHSWQLLPESEAKPFPEYIPQQLREDYNEACLIKHKSPKASATLSRRCLQGMIRDFWKIKKSRLIDEIEGIKTKVDGTVWKAIDSVRHVGNIGAHMEKDVNLIIDVDSEEAGLLIWLIENLFEEWYVARHDRAAKMGAIVNIAEQKKALKVVPKLVDNQVVEKTV